MVEVFRAGAALSGARGVVVMLHGRGAGAEDILGLGSAFGLTGVALLAPQAVGRTWYPASFMAPRGENEPCVTEALLAVEATVGLALQAGIGLEKVGICGFSQGACLASEYLATRPGRYAGVVAYTGGLIGGGSWCRMRGIWRGRRYFWDRGIRISMCRGLVWWRRRGVLRGLGAQVEARRYADRDHTVRAEELAQGRALFQAALG